MDQIIRIQPDKERARSLVKIAGLRYEKINTFDEEKESQLIVEGYYEVAKELITAILFINGYKTLSHKDLVEYLELNFKKDFQRLDIELLNQLRILRNKIVYYGEQIESSYISRNKRNIFVIISKLFDICERKLK
ncbi:MAG: hypothetical protein AABX25_01625 [Nanoarchaeota archaeon]